MFSLFKQTIQILQQINVKKCPSGIQHQDSSKQPHDYVSPPLTTRSGQVEYLKKVRLPKLFNSAISNSFFIIFLHPPAAR